MSDKERLHRIWITTEYLFTWWQYLSEEERLSYVSHILEDARNHEQVEQLRERLHGLETGRIGQP